MKVQIPRPALFAIAAGVAVVAASPAMAYVGPGAGLTLLGALWGLIIAVVVSLGFVLLWPLRRLMRRSKRVGPAVDNPPGDEDPAGSMIANSSGDRNERRM